MQDTTGEVAQSSYCIIKIMFIIFQYRKITCFNKYVFWQISHVVLITTWFLWWSCNFFLPRNILGHWAHRNIMKTLQTNKITKTDWISRESYSIYTLKSRHWKKEVLVQNVVNLKLHNGTLNIPPTMRCPTSLDSNLLIAVEHVDILVAKGRVVMTRPFNLRAPSLRLK